MDYDNHTELVIAKERQEEASSKTVSFHLNKCTGAVEDKNPEPLFSAQQLHSLKSNLRRQYYKELIKTLQAGEANNFNTLMQSWEHFQ